MTRPLRVGDRVTATGTVTGVNPDYIYVRFDGASLPNGFYRLDEALTLIAPAEPPVGSVVVKDGRAYMHESGLTALAGEPWWSPLDGEWFAWSVISDGDVIFTPGGDA